MANFPIVKHEFLFQFQLKIYIFIQEHHKNTIVSKKAELKFVELWVWTKIETTTEKHSMGGSTVFRNTRKARR